MKTSIGNKIRKLRDIKEYSQEYMAQKMGITASAYSKIERDETDITFNRLEEIAKILEVDTQTIMNFDEKQIFNFNNSHQNTVGNREAHVYHNDKLVDHLEKEVLHLRTENTHLRTENTRLIDIVARKKERKGDPSV
jgi:transcriptional regulator with XRE-family HTH domain